MIQLDLTQITEVLLFDPSKTERATAFLPRRVAYNMLETVVLLYRCTLFQPLYTGKYVHKRALIGSIDDGRRRRRWIWIAMC